MPLDKYYTVNVPLHRSPAKELIVKVTFQAANSYPAIYSYTKEKYKIKIIVIIY